MNRKIILDAAIKVEVGKNISAFMGNATDSQN